MSFPRHIQTGILNLAGMLVAIATSLQNTPWDSSIPTTDAVSPQLNVHMKDVTFVDETPSL